MCLWKVTDESQPLFCNHRIKTQWNATCSFSECLNKETEMVGQDAFPLQFFLVLEVNRLPCASCHKFRQMNQSRLNLNQLFKMKNKGNYCLILRSAWLQHCTVRKAAAPSPTTFHKPWKLKVLIGLFEAAETCLIHCKPIHNNLSCFCLPANKEGCVVPQLCRW